MKALIGIGVIAGMVMLGAWSYFSYQIPRQVRAEQNIAEAFFASEQVALKAQGKEVPAPASSHVAMLAYIGSQKNSFAERDKMVWALGCCGDQADADFLKQYVTDKPCDHESGQPRTALCQHELKKAIQKIEALGGGSSASEAQIGT